MSHYEDYYEERAEARRKEVEAERKKALAALLEFKKRVPYGWPLRFEGHIEDMLNWLRR